MSGISILNHPTIPDTDPYTVPFFHEVVEERDKKYRWDKNIVKFRTTQLGLYIFHRALFENYL